MAERTVAPPRSRLRSATRRSLKAKLGDDALDSASPAEALWKLRRATRYLKRGHRADVRAIFLDAYEAGLQMKADGNAWVGFINIPDAFELSFRLPRIEDQDDAPVHAVRYVFSGPGLLSQKRASKLAGVAQFLDGKGASLDFAGDLLAKYGLEKLARFGAQWRKQLRLLTSHESNNSVGVTTDGADDPLTSRGTATLEVLRSQQSDDDPPPMPEPDETSNQKTTEPQYREISPHNADGLGSTLRVRIPPKYIEPLQGIVASDTVHISSTLDPETGMLTAFLIEIISKRSAARQT